MATRKEILKRMGLSVPEEARIRVLVDTDAKNEADDHYASSTQSDAGRMRYRRHSF